VGVKWTRGIKGRGIEDVWALVRNF
jgi:hypothetical protein